MDLVLHPKFLISRKHNFEVMDLFPSWGEGRETPPLLASSERSEGTKILKPSDFEYYTQSEEPFIVQVIAN
jgi:hypothetical protein